MKTPLDTAFECSPHSMIIIETATDLVIDCNESFCQTLGYKKNEIVGKNVTDIGGWLSPKQWNAMKDEIHTRHNVYNYQVSLKNKSGKTEEYNLTAIASQTGEIPCITLLVTNITEKKLREHKFRRMVKKNMLYYQIVISINQMIEAPVKEILDYTLEAGLTLTDSRIGFLFFYDEAKQKFTLHAWSKEVMAMCDSVNYQREIDLAQAGIWGEAVRQRQPIIINDYQAPHPLKRGLPEGHMPIIRHLSIPVFDKGQIVAVLGVANKESDYHEDNMQQLSMLMDSVWALIKRKEAEKRLRKSEAWFRSTFEQAMVGICLATLDGRISRANRRFCDIMGYTENELEKVKFSEHAFGDDAADFEQQLKRLLQHEMDTFSMEKRYLRKDTSLIWVNLTVSKLYLNADEQIYLLVIVEDITEAKRAQTEILRFKAELEERVTQRTEELQSTMEKLQDAYQFTERMWRAAPVGIMIYDREGRCIQYNEAAVAIVGMGSSDLSHQDFPQLSEWCNVKLREIAQKTLAEGEETGLETHFTTPYKKELWLECRLVRFYTKDQPNLLLIANDIFEKKQTEQNMNLFFDTTVEMLAIIGVDGYFQRLSPTWSKNLGWSEEELTSRSIMELVHPEDWELTTAAVKRLILGFEVISYENRVRCKDGSFRWLAWNASSDWEKKIFIVAVRDVTGQKKFQAELQRAKEEAERAVQAKSEVLADLSRTNGELIKANQVINTQNMQLKEVLAKLELLATTDELTHIHNRRHMVKKLEEEKTRFGRSHKPFSVIMADIDFYKNINDTYGHDCGDYVLETLARFLADSLRGMDGVARWGGEEFLILMPDTGLDGAAVLAERIRANLKLKLFRYKELNLSCAMTFGVAEYNGTDTIDQLIKKADDALYRGKQNGRDRVELAR